MADGEKSTLARVLRLTQLLEDALLVLLLAAMIVLAGAQIVLRNLFDSAIVWADPLLRVGVLWVGMIGAMVATRGDKQISIDAVSKFLPPRMKAGIRVVTDIFTAGVSAVVAWSAFRLMLEDRAAGGLTIGFVPVWICEAVVPVALAVIAFRYLVYAVRHARESVVKVELP
jgi:TRAP-type C4-dicarboxylate transport system permease small subunit